VTVEARIEKVVAVIVANGTGIVTVIVILDHIVVVPVIMKTMTGARNAQGAGIVNVDANAIVTHDQGVVVHVVEVAVMIMIVIGDVAPAVVAMIVVEMSVAMNQIVTAGIAVVGNVAAVNVHM